MQEVIHKATIGLGILAVAATQVDARQPNCAPRDMVLQRLAQGYGESRQAIGLGSNNAMFEVFASEAGSWTITVTFPDGATCLVASGQAFESLSETPLLSGQDA